MNDKQFETFMIEFRYQMELIRVAIKEEVKQLLKGKD